MFQAFPVLAGRHAYDLCERTKKVGIIVEAALVGNIIQGGSSQDLLTGKDYPTVENVVVDAAVCKPGELMGQPGHADAEGTG